MTSGCDWDIGCWYTPPMNGLPAEGKCIGRRVQCPCKMPGTQIAQPDPEPVLAQTVLEWRLVLAEVVHLH